MEDQKMDNLLNLASDSTEEERRKSGNLNVGYTQETGMWDIVIKYSGEIGTLSGEGVREEDLTWMAEKTKQKLSGWKFMVMVFVGVLPIVALVGSNNLSTAVIILGIAVILIFVTNPRYLPFVGVAGAGTVLVAVFLSLESYRLERLAIWRNPEAYEKGFQTIQGLYAIGDRACGRLSCDPGFWPFNLAADGHCCPCPGPGGNPDRVRNHGTYSHSGHTEHCRCDQHDSQYGNYPSIYQLRRDFRRLSAGGNGACPFGYTYEKIAVPLAERLYKKEKQTKYEWTTAVRW